MAAAAALDNHRLTRKNSGNVNAAYRRQRQKTASLAAVTTTGTADYLKAGLGGSGAGGAMGLKMKMLSSLSNRSTASSRSRESQNTAAAATYSRANNSALFPAQDLALLRYGYRVGDILGEGSYAKVRKAYFQRELYAIKIISKSKVPKDFLEKFLPRELKILQMVKHENIIRVREIFQIRNKICVVMDIAENGDLLEYIKDNGPLLQSVACRMFRELALAVEFCHSLDIAHRDLKCENLLLDKNMTIKLTDFGFSRECIDPVSMRRSLSETFCGSAAYASPEVLRGLPYNPKMYDIWSLGCVLYIMVSGSMPYDDTDMHKMLRAQMGGPVGFPKKISSTINIDCRRLIHHMLEPDILKRATIGQIIGSKWLQKKTSSSAVFTSFERSGVATSSTHANKHTTSSRTDRTLPTTTSINSPPVDSSPPPLAAAAILGPPLPQTVDIHDNRTTPMTPCGGKQSSKTSSQRHTHSITSPLAGDHQTVSLLDRPSASSNRTTTAAVGNVAGSNPPMQTTSKTPTNTSNHCANFCSYISTSSNKSRMR